MKSDDVDACPKTEAAFALLAKKWAALIVLRLNRGELRFVELRSSIPELSARMLALRMRDLEAAGLVERSVSSQGAIRVAYRLTEKGRSLAGIMERIADWAKRYS